MLNLKKISLKLNKEDFENNEREREKKTTLKQDNKTGAKLHRTCL